MQARTPFKDRMQLLINHLPSLTVKNKTMIKRLFLTLICASCLTIVRAQTTPNEIVEKFFGMYSKEPLTAVDYIFSTNKWVANKEEGVRDLKNKLKITIEGLGEYCGYEVLAEKTAGANVKLMTFLVKYDRQPLRLTLLFYKPRDKWQLNHFSYGEGLSEELEEASKLYRLKENNNW
jgi:hypothetical protein